MNSRRPCIFGEVLFDHFPDGSRILGGAPFNVAWHLQAFGQAPRFISRVGDDIEGAQVREAMADWGMDTDAVQSDDSLPTGRVNVTLEGNEPSYDIVRPAAFDAIDSAEICNDCELLYHGSLALRDTASRAALDRVLATTRGLVFIDVNLRPPWWDREHVIGLLARADWLKINIDELRTLHPERKDDDDNVRHLIDDHGLDGVVVTRGADGATLFARGAGDCSVAPDASVDLVDTVGAGDAFAAVIILGLIHQWPHATMLERAQAFASRVVANRGAILTENAAYRPFVENWKLAN
ncbi:MAG: carbohydrate kinase [Gammaproteobacteria bacterium]|nr:carbohydrate kinase [Gammaproteobacteria bacterium]